MLAVTVDQVKAGAAVAAAALVVLAIGSAWLMRTIVQKAVVAVVLVVLAAVVWTQRGSLDDCADQVRASGGRSDTTCSFFGRDVTIATDRGR